MPLRVVLTVGCVRTRKDTTRRDLVCFGRRSIDCEIVYLLAGIGQLQSGLHIGGESNPLFGYRYYYLYYSLILYFFSLSLSPLY
jgi:hypothetical protein